MAAELKQIWKYPWPATNRMGPDKVAKFQMPKGAKTLTVQNQNGWPQFWALVSPNEPMVEREFHLFGTGHDLNDDIDPNAYVGTFQMHDGQLVLHVFEACA